MFLSNEGKPQSVSLIDWQISRYASPILDLANFIFISTDKALRDAHLERLIKQYYDIFSELVRKLGSEPEKVFPFSEYKQQWKDFAKYGLIMAINVVPLIAVPAEQVKQMEDQSKLENGTRDPAALEEWNKVMTEIMGRTATRVKDIVEDFQRLGFL